MDIARFKIITYVVRHINNRYINTVVYTWLVKPIFDVLVVFFAHHYLLSTVVSVESPEWLSPDLDPVLLSQ
jgi:hypothetical protein